MWGEWRERKRSTASQLAISVLHHFPALSFRRYFPFSFTPVKHRPDGEGGLFMMSLLLLLLSLLLCGSQLQAGDYVLQVKRVVKAQEGLCILVPCSFSSPEARWYNAFSAYGYWFKEIRKPSLDFPVATNNENKLLEPGTQGRFQLLGDLLKRDCSLLIKDVYWRDAARYFFRIERGFEKFSFLDGFTLQVEALTQKPDIFIPEILEPGHPVTAVCLFSWTSEQCPAPSFSWTGAAVSTQEPRQQFSYYSVLSFTARLEHHDTELTCRLEFSRKNMQRTVRLSVAYAPRSLAISIFRDNVSVAELPGDTPHLEVQQGQSLHLLCTADSQPPAALSWALEDRVLSWSSPVGSRSLALELRWVKAADTGRYTCQAENMLGSQQRTLDLSVLYPPEDLRVTVSQANRTVLQILRNVTSLAVLEGQSLYLVCVTYSNPPASLSWAGGTQTLIPTQSSEPGVLELPLVQREHEGEFTCTAQNPLGARSISLSLSVHYKDSPSAFSKGAVLGFGITALLALCLIMIIVKTLQKKGSHDKTLRPKLSRGSTVLDYINVFPKTRSLARNCKAKPETPSRVPPLDAQSPKSKKNQEEPHVTPPGCPGPRSSSQAPVSEHNPEELHYAALTFSRLRLGETQDAQDASSDYAEVRFH
ncbi:sialic acid-binding Ig-like lectin 10 isoform X2 [Psammomys obesus]|uniref:sialic acid-binding Ig-like lectin 10 isoform X2 n=1 Tax=Psammomys obesus TaxID=48139 RepID=UPI002452C2E3|nr:sialic acid-binding Ig-like lectin 10 isoform X2 [Psammomys obesus]